MGFSLTASDDDWDRTPETPYPLSEKEVSGHRYYMPEVGRWISRDPIGEAGSYNLYINCGNELIDDVDILGLVPSATPFNDLETSLFAADHAIKIGFFRHLTGWEPYWQVLRARLVALGASSVVATSEEPSWSSYNQQLEWKSSSLGIVKARTALHELIHASRMTTWYYLAVHRLQTEEGVAYAGNLYYDLGKSLGTLESVLERMLRGSGQVGRGCEVYRSRLAFGWSSAWDVNDYSTGVGFVDDEPFPLTDTHWTEFANTYKVKVSCQALADAYTRTASAAGCCFRFTCSTRAALNEFSLKRKVPSGWR